MSNVTVTMLKSGRTDDWGRPLVAGSSYSLDFDRAKSLWQAGFASVSDPTVFDDDSAPNAGGFIRYSKFTGFRRCLLASLVANTTASRTNGLVTLAATSHGITTGGTYQGFRFFYPGSSNLTAGWYDSIVEIPTANSLSFYAPGPDFSSESVNGAAAYTTATSIQGQGTIDKGVFKDDSTVRVIVPAGGGTTAATKTLRPLINGNVLVAATTTTSPFSVREWELIPILPKSVGGLLMLFNGASGTIQNQIADRDLDISITLQLTISAASDFIAVLSTPRLVWTQ